MKNNNRCKVRSSVKNLHLSKNRVQKGIDSYVLNSIVDTHEHAVVQAESRKDRYLQLYTKLKAFQEEQEEEDTSTRQHYEWIRNYRELEREAQCLFKAISLGLEKIEYFHASAGIKNAKKIEDKTNQSINQYRCASNEKEIAGDNPTKCIKSDSLTDIQNMKMSLALLMNGNLSNEDSINLKTDLIQTISYLRKKRKELDRNGTESAKANFTNKLNTLKSCHSYDQSLFTKETTDKNDEKLKNAFLAESILTHHRKLDKLCKALENEHDEAYSAVRDSYIQIAKHLREDKNDSSHNFPTEIREAILQLESKYSNHGNAIESIYLLQEKIKERFDMIHNDEATTSLTYKNGNSNDGDTDNIINNVWDDDKNTIFMKNFHQWKKAPTPNGKRLTIKHICREIPSINPIDVSKHWDEVEKLNISWRKQKYQQISMSKRKTGFIKRAMDAIEKLETELGSHQMNTVEESLTKAISSERHHRLDVRRDVHSKKNEIITEQETVIREKRLLKNRFEQTQELRTRQKIKAEVNIFKEKKLKEKKQIKSKENIEKCLDEVKRLERMQKNGPRIIYREQLRKEEEKFERERLNSSIQSETRRLERLTALAATVPYFSAIIAKTADLQKTTKSRLHDVFEKDDGSLADYQKGKLKTFSNDAIFSDPRFRLGHALREAGLSNTSYAREVIKKIIPRETERTTGIEPF